jgi:hypothetical protein
MEYWSVEKGIDFLAITPGKENQFALLHKGIILNVV